MIKKEYWDIHENIFKFMDTNSSTIMIVASIMIISYFYFRNKIKMIYLLDFFIVSGFLLTLWIMIAPHRYQGVISFIQLSLMR